MSKKLRDDRNLDPQGSQELTPPAWKTKGETVLKPFSHLPFLPKR